MQILARKNKSQVCGIHQCRKSERSAARGRDLMVTVIYPHYETSHLKSCNPSVAGWPLEQVRRLKDKQRLARRSNYFY